MNHDERKQLVQQMFATFMKSHRNGKGLSEQYKKDLWAAFNAGIICGWETITNQVRTNNENIQINDGN